LIYQEVLLWISAESAVVKTLGRILMHCSATVGLLPTGTGNDHGKSPEHRETFESGITASRGWEDFFG
jgi:hypothetical protein